MRTVLIASALAVLTFTTATAALASGSGSGASRSGGGGFSGFPQASLSPAEQLERRGQTVIRKRITCKKCAYNDRLDRQTAAEIAEGVRSGQFEIEDGDRQAVLYYLRSRYGV
ncbi:MAG: hypothetical protein WC692_10905 [Erythrobacter sp.]|jgi:hypothetical protein